MNQKIEWLRNKMKVLDIQGMLVTNPVNVSYLTGINAEGTLIINPLQNIFITDARYVEAVNSIITLDDEIVVYDSRDLEESDYEDFFKNVEKVGYEEYYMTCAEHKKCMIKYKINEFVETDRLIEMQRQVKTEDELEKIEKACKLTDKCFEHLVEFIKPGMTELEVSTEITNFFLSNGAEALAFDSIVASGVNSSKPHAVPTNKEIEIGDPITIDIGCKVDGYCSDMTRTLFLGEVPEDIKPIYDLVLKDQLRVIEQTYAGQSVKELSKLVESDFNLHGQSLIHALGHGVGLDVHEFPYFSVNSENTLREKMVITDEPGIYIAGRFGVRIEDTMIVTNSGVNILTNFPKDYTVIDV